MAPTLDLRHVGLLFLMVHSAQPLIEKLFESKLFDEIKRLDVMWLLNF